MSAKLAWEPEESVMLRYLSGGGWLVVTGLPTPWSHETRTEGTLHDHVEWITPRGGRPESRFGTGPAIRWQ